jgi:hypothetical protein
VRRMLQVSDVSRVRIREDRGILSGGGQDPGSSTRRLQRGREPSPRPHSSVQVIGEAARHVSPEFTATHPETPWENIVGMRHKVAHDYLGVDEDIVWQVVTEDLPSLVRALEPLVPPAP